MTPSPPNKKQLLQSALAAHRRGSLDRASEFYEAVLAVDPGDPQANHYLGVIAYQQGKPQKAVSLIEAALRGDPGRADFHCNLGNAQKMLGKTQEAVESYRRAVTIRPDYSHGWSNLGVALQALGRLQEALESYVKALAAEPRAQPHTGRVVGVRPGYAGPPAHAGSTDRSELTARPRVGGDLRVKAPRSPAEARTCALGASGFT